MALLPRAGCLVPAGEFDEHVLQHIGTHRSAARCQGIRPTSRNDLNLGRSHGDARPLVF